MPLPAATALGPYRIVAALGAGGMGEVYRACDTRLNREVAIKVLPAGLARDPDRLRRFELEARAASQLNHPNILTVYEFGLSDGAPYIATELLEGETLRQRLSAAGEAPPAASGVALTPRKAADIGGQITRGLAAAHAKGIVHRDLKPENVFLARDGQVKILDFGLAKLAPAAASGAGDDAATLPAAEATAAGQVLGTAAYMSPEQARGQAADARSDLFALGAMLYEMLTGRRAFQRPSAVETMAAILKEDPAPLPPALADSGWARLIDHCLEKDPTARFQSARDLEFALAALASPSSTVRAAALPPPRRWRGWAAAAAGAGLLAAGFLAGERLRRHASAPAAPGLRFAISPPAGARFGDGLALSPDGRRLAFAATIHGQTRIWLRPLDGAGARPVPGTAGGALPFWSPGGGRLGFFTANHLKSVSLANGMVRVLAPVTPDAGRGGAWAPNGTIVFAPDVGTPLLRTTVQGATPPVTRPGRERADRWPQFLPDGRHFLFFRMTEDGHGHLFVGALGGAGERRVAGSQDRWSRAIYAGGALLYALNGRLVAQPFDWRHARATGPPRALDARLTPVGEVGPTAYIALSASRNGLLAWQPTAAPLSRLVVVNRAGQVLRAVGAPARYSQPTPSPNGRTIAADEFDPASGRDAVWLLDMASGAARRFTFGGAEDLWPLWSPHGNWIYFSSSSAAGFGVYRKRADGVGGVERVTRPSTQTQADSISPGGQVLLLGNANTATGVLEQPLAPLDAPPGPRAVADARNASFSPDGRWVAYTGMGGATPQVFVMPFPPNGSRWQISADGGDWAQWGPRGGHLYFLGGQDLMAARVDAGSGAAFQFQPPRPLFPFQPLDRSFAGDYAVLSGGRFLLNQPADGGAAGAIQIASRWPRSLAR